MSTDLITYLNYISDWNDESDANVDCVIKEYNNFLLMGTFEYKSAVNRVFDDIKNECITVRDETIAADAVQIAADAAAIASIWSFGLGMAAYAALETSVVIERKFISDKSKELNTKLTDADSNIASSINPSVANYVAAYKANNTMIAAAAPKGLDTRRCRSILYQFVTKLKSKYNKSLNVTNFRTYAESARLLFNSTEITQIYDALDEYNLSNKTDVDLSKFLDVLANFKYPNPLAQEIIFNVSFGILL
jgi:hypothetical protein